MANNIRAFAANIIREFVANNIRALAANIIREFVAYNIRAFAAYIILLDINLLYYINVVISLFFLFL